MCRTSLIALRKRFREGVVSVWGWENSLFLLSNSENMQRPRVEEESR